MLERLLINIIPVTVFFGLGIANTYEENVSTEAIITIKKGSTNKKITGQYAEKGLQENADGTLIFDNNIDWCNKLPSSVVSKLPQPKEWIALIPSNINCTCSKKLAMAKKNNATAAIISKDGHKDKKGCEDSMYPYDNIVSVVVGRTAFRKLITIYKSEPSETVNCKIMRGKKSLEKQFKVSRTSVLFVLVSFILLMCISLAWLVFYYVQRFRHIYRNDRKEKQLLSAAKKAISKLKTISFQAGNKDGEEDSCAVCLENYKDGENIRVLPCKHLFHKACIDPWLLNHRTCPMCKSNILKSLGVEIPDNIDITQFDVESRRLSREVDNVQSAPAPAVPAEEALPDEHAVPSTSVFSAGDASQAWSEPNVVSASCCSSTSSMLSDTDSERSTVALVSIVQKV